MYSRMITAGVLATSVLAGPAGASILGGVSDNDGGNYAIVTDDTLDNGDLAYTDSTTQVWANVPSLVQGAQYVQTAQGDNSNSDLEVFLNITGAGSLFVFHSASVTDPGWLSSGFTDTGETLDLSGSPESGAFGIYERTVTGGETVTLFANDPGTTNSGEMYGIAALAAGGGGTQVIPVPASAFLLGTALLGIGAARRFGRG